MVEDKQSSKDFLELYCHSQHSECKIYEVGLISTFHSQLHYEHGRSWETCAQKTWCKQVTSENKTNLRNKMSGSLMVFEGLESYSVKVCVCVHVYYNLHAILNTAVCLSVQKYTSHLLSAGDCWSIH